VSHILTINAKAADVTETPKLIYNRYTFEETVLSRVPFLEMYSWRFMGVEAFIVWL